MINKFDKGNSMYRVMLIYPPGKLYQRGEDRSQGNLDDSAVMTPRASNDLGYAASTLKRLNVNFEIFLKDYQGEHLSFIDLANDFKEFQPNALMMSITNATIFEDIKIINAIYKLRPECIMILKGALFYDAIDNVLQQLNLRNITYLIGGESDFIIDKLLYSHFYDKDKIHFINGIFYKVGDKFIKTSFDKFECDLDMLPFPDRGMMNNALYVRPDTDEPMATITTSRGCPSNCIYCLTPHISGKKVRLRSPQNIADELYICYKQHDIDNFFFKSDTFTIDKKWVLELCNLITASELDGKISWVANSRAHPLEQQTLHAMKKAGCRLVAFGFESGSPETLKRIKKGATVEQNLAAAEMARAEGLKTLGFYMIGFPWETMNHINETIEMIYRIDADYIELHLAIPYYGTELYTIAENEGLIADSILGGDYFNPPIVGTKYISLQDLRKLKKNLLLRYCIRPSYICRRLLDSCGNPRILANYAKFGLRLLVRALPWQQKKV
jgi:radical SAM superfamily enzyme YgiQ (UPF0313 family)